MSCIVACVAHMYALTADVVLQMFYASIGTARAVPQVVLLACAGVPPMAMAAVPFMRPWQADRRQLTEGLLQLVTQHRAVLVRGPPQSGKTSLAALVHNTALASDHWQHVVSVSMVENSVENASLDAVLQHAAGTTWQGFWGSPRQSLTDQASSFTGRCTPGGTQHAHALLSSKRCGRCTEQ